MKLISNILISTILISLINGDKVQKHLHILVLYESLCPDSVRFFQQQLQPTYNHVKDYINIKLVPFGKSYSMYDGLKFECQHGPSECRGNRIQSCALNNIEDQDKQVLYATCQMSGLAELTEKHCAKVAEIPHDTLDSCINSSLGTTLQLQAESITNSFNPVFIPTIIYDGVFDQQLQDRSQYEFLLVVCHLLKNKGSHYPNICN